MVVKISSKSSSVPLRIIVSSVSQQIILASASCRLRHINGGDQRVGPFAPWSSKHSWGRLRCNRCEARFQGTKRVVFLAFTTRTLRGHKSSVVGRPTLFH